MERRTAARPRMAASMCIALALGSFACAATAGTTGKLAGRILDAKKQPLVGANVIVVGMPLGAATDADGGFAILNIPAGTITVKASLIGYTAVTVQNVLISADNTTRQDMTLQESAVQLQEVVVSAHRSVIEVNRTSNIATVSRQQIQQLPVQELQDVVNLQAGVVDGHFRGGRDDEVQYQVDGVSVNNAYDNKASLRLDRSILEEVQVISGTFDAEYGQAMSGVVNAVLKRGGDKLHWNAEVYSGGPLYGSGAGRIVPNDQGIAALQSYQLSLDGPTKLPGTTYLLSGRYSVDDNWVRGASTFEPWDVNLDTLGRRSLRPTGDRGSVVLGYSRESSGIVKLTNRSIQGIELSYQAILDVIGGRNASWLYRLEPGGLTQQHTVSLVQGMDLTHTLSASRFYTLSVRQNYKDYTDLAFDSVWDHRYDLYGAPITYTDLHGTSWAIQGVDLNRFKQNTNGAIVKGSFVDQVAKDHQFKVGGEFQAPHVQFGSPGYVQYAVDSASGGAQVIQRRTAYDPKFPGVQEYRPLFGAAFAQEELEWNDLTLRGGVRLDFFDARAYSPSDLANPANSIADVPQSHLVKAKTKFAFAPRLGVSYPISSTASLFFAYGHFYQFPGLGQIFQYADYNRLADLQATDLSVPVMGNPDIRPEKTVQYQFGYKQAIREDLGLDVTAFYKDIRDLLGTQIIETYNGAEYARLANVDFGSVIGFTVTLTQRSAGPFSSKLDYTWQLAQGNSSDPNETATRAAAGEDASPRSIPFNWDQRHTLNATLTLAKPDRYTLGAILRATSGQPFTPALTTGFSGGLETNSGRKPNTFTTDLRGDYALPKLGPGGQVFLRMFNVFDTRFDNGFVFDTSGDPYYSRFPAKDEGALGDPTRFFGPRRIELGLAFGASR